MKKLLFGLIATVLIAGFASGQAFYSTAHEATGNNAKEGHETLNGLTCPPASLYSQNVDYVTGFTSCISSPYIVFDQLIAIPTDLVGEITFYGICEGPADRNFTISFYQDNGGFPDESIATYTTFITGNNTGQLAAGYPIYSYYFAFPEPVDLVAGDWISIFADGQYGWYWCSAIGGDGCVLQTSNGIRCDYGDVAFCLGGVNSGPTTVPVANWALLIGGILIAGALFLRYRRIF